MAILDYIIFYNSQRTHSVLDYNTPMLFEQQFSGSRQIAKAVRQEEGIYQLLLKQYQPIGSMSRKGNCWDNPIAESFFHTLRVELIHNYGLCRKSCQDSPELRRIQQTPF